MNSLRPTSLCVLMLAAVAMHQSASGSDTATSIGGDWLAPAEDADDVNAIITIVQSGSSWSGRIKLILVQDPHQKIQDDTVCGSCQGSQHGQPYKGLQVIWDMKSTSEGWSSGQILDPSDGQVYQCDMRLSADARTLRVTAYKGIRLLGHTMVWQRP
jgi:uncharacterized protein (DUF2147 family)